MLMSEEKRRQEVMTMAFDGVLQECSSQPAGCEILRELNRGGMAVVYLAQQREPRRKVALKVVLPRFLGDEGMHDRFKREGWAMAALEHPGILPIYQVGEWDGLAFMLMKLASGGRVQLIVQGSDHKGILSLDADGGDHRSATVGCETRIGDPRGDLRAGNDGGGDGPAGRTHFTAGKRIVITWRGHWSFSIGD
ncbi:hypothetical protein N9891_00185 [bacterium]|nr:hypothetical protein [bacterium]